MVEISSARIICGVGSILMLLIFIPVIGIALFIAGIILVAIGIKQISDALKREDIYRNYLIYLILGVIAIAIFYIGLIGIVLRLFIGGIFHMPKVLLLNIMKTTLEMIIVLVVAWIVFILSSLFYKRSFDEIAKIFNISLFSITAIIYLIGSILTIIGIGFILIYIAIILQTIAFFILPERIEVKTPSQQISLV